ncbi:hypothetical protein BGZ83_000336 [Gryganskiella cystojenkinii]|nr:hypothetical protein BGZ83_000336 [Gryganskiella cystojenkinii]
MQSSRPAYEHVFGLPELLSQIEPYLTPSDLCQCTQVSRYFYKLWNRTFWSKVISDREGLPHFLGNYCHWVESWERVGSTLPGCEYIDELDQVRTSCLNLQELKLSLPESNPCGVLRSFFGLSEERVDQGGTQIHGHDPIYHRRLFCPGRVELVRQDDEGDYDSDSDNNIDNDSDINEVNGGVGLQQSDMDVVLHKARLMALVDKQERYFPEFAQNQTLPNAFLSNRLRILEIGSPLTPLPILDWLTRAAIEGHIQGLERFKLFSSNDMAYHPYYGEGWHTTRTQFLQFLGACPRLTVYEGPFTVVKADESHCLYNQDWTETSTYPTGPWQASNFMGSGKNGSKAAVMPIALKELHLSTIDFNNDDEGNQDPLLYEMFLHLPALISLTLEDQVEDEKTVRALELAYHDLTRLDKSSRLALCRHDPRRPLPTMPPPRDSATGFFLDQQRPNYRLEQLRNLQPPCSRGYLTHPWAGTKPEIVQSWTRFVALPWLRLSKIEFESRQCLPETFLETLAGAESVRRHLKSLLIGLQWDSSYDEPESWTNDNLAAGQAEQQEPHLPHFRTQSISLLLQSCFELREIQLPMTQSRGSGFFTVEEADLWSRRLHPTDIGADRELSGCRDKLERIRFSGVRLDVRSNSVEAGFESSFSSERNKAFREWMTALKGLKELTIEGTGFTMESLIDTATTTAATAAAAVAEFKDKYNLSRCNQVQTLCISAADWQRLDPVEVQEMKLLVERFPKLTSLTLPRHPCQPEVWDWIENHCPRLFGYQIRPRYDDEEDEDDEEKREEVVADGDETVVT